MPFASSDSSLRFTVKFWFVQPWFLRIAFSYIVGNSDLENNKFVFDLYKGGVYSEGIAEVNIASYWK